MKGDFSRWDAVLAQNQSGVLHQQGRVLLDRDWNDQARLTAGWQDRTGRHVVGQGIMAVPVGAPGAFQVTEAAVEDGAVVVTLQPGEGWADGLAVQLADPDDPAAPLRRRAAYVGPPIQVPQGEVDDIEAGVRDAVLLEVWREALHGFQRPGVLIEPALGGPDTTERLQTTMRCRLYRMQPDDTCRSLVGRLNDDDALKGRLTVTLQPTTTTDGDCPVVEGGGYAGFEHHLYRIEIAQTDTAVPTFKWSVFNGGLVGRGRCELGTADPRITITANDQAIKTAGPDSFYMEVVEHDDEDGGWRVTYGADVTLNGDDLEVTTVRYQEAALPTDRVFFRLWNGIEPVEDFPNTAAAPEALRDGIRLAFDSPEAGAHYRAGDYWTFSVRAGGLANDQTLVEDAPPAGPRYHRVPLAELHWNDAASVSFATGEIEDCRDRFRPLTEQKGCCTFTVGDGRHSRGDFDSIEEALRRLPPDGGEVCVLPGVHQANVTLLLRRDIRIHGCGERTLIHAHPDRASEPLFRLASVQNISLENLSLLSVTGTAIQVADPEDADQPSRGIRVANNDMVAGIHAVEVVVQNTRAGDNDIRIIDNRIALLDTEGAGAAVFSAADDVRIEGNKIAVVPAPDPEDPDDPRGPRDDPSGDPFGPCLDLQRFYASETGVRTFVAETLHFVGLVSVTPAVRYVARGGIQVGSGSERIRIIDNEVAGGAGHGITLGGAIQLPTPPQEEPEEETFELTNRQDEIWARVLRTDTNAFVGGVSLSFDGDDGTVITGTSDSTGIILVDADPGVYDVRSASPEYRVVEVTATDQGEFGTLHVISVEPVEDDDMDIDPALAFLYDVTIIDNEITGMALSGVGVPLEVSVENASVVSRRAVLAHYLLSLLGTPVVNLAIRGNNITRCFHHPYDRSLRNVLQNRGLFGMALGGITLGACAHLSVVENRIEDNGQTGSVPASGVYVMYGEHIEVSRNRIANNGRPPDGEEDDAERGLRGGVVAFATSASLLGVLETQEALGASGKPAARIHDNVVDQPVGHALTLLGLGPVAVTDNHFNSAVSASNSWVDAVGTVLIYNLGGLGATLGGGASSETTAFTVGAASAIPGGDTLFNSNRTRLGPASESLIAQVLVSLSDVGFCDNQSAVYTHGGSVAGADSFVVNTVIGGRTLRASSSRFTEPVRAGSPKLSLVSSSTEMNHTTYNQGNHCIVAASSDTSKLEEAGNNVLNSEVCSEMNRSRSGVLTLLALLFGGRSR